MNAVEAAEIQTGKDIAQMSEVEASAAVSKMDLNSLGTVYGKRIVIREYLAWCKNNSVFDPVSDGFLKALSPDLDISPEITRMIFRDDADLVLSMQKVCPLNNGHFEPVVLALAWMGLTKQQALALRDSEINLDERWVMRGDLVEYIPDAVWEVLSLFEQGRIGFRENRTATYQVVKDYSFDRFVKRFAPPDSSKIGEPLSQRQVESGIYRMNQRYIEKGYPPRLTYSNVWKSGRFHALLELERTGVDVFSFENKDKVMLTFGSMNYRNILWFYKAYKRAFDL